MAAGKWRSSDEEAEEEAPQLRTHSGERWEAKVGSEGTKGQRPTVCVPSCRWNVLVVLSPGCSLLVGGWFRVLL